MILSILSERYWGIGNSSMSAQKTSLASSKLKIFRASGREGRRRKLSRSVLLPPVIQPLREIYRGDRWFFMVGLSTGSRHFDNQVVWCQTIL